MSEEYRGGKPPETSTPDQEAPKPPEESIRDTESRELARLKDKAEAAEMKEGDTSERAQAEMKKLETDIEYDEKLQELRDDFQLLVGETASLFEYVQENKDKVFKFKKTIVDEIKKRLESIFEKATSSYEYEDFGTQAFKRNDNSLDNPDTQLAHLYRDIYKKLDDLNRNIKISRDKAAIISHTSEQLSLIFGITLQSKPQSIKREVIQSFDLPEYAGSYKKAEQVGK